MDSQILENPKACTTLPTLPGVAIQILDLCQREEPDLPKMAQVIGQDPALSVRLLKIVNSPYFAVPRQVAKLDHAVALLGVDAVRTLALTFSIVKSLRRDSTEGADLSRFWRRSPISGVAARQLGQWATLPDPEALFLAALLQDIGTLALRTAFSRKYPPLLARSQDDHRALIALEQAELGTDHAEVGGWLAQLWQLPGIYEISLRGSHDPDQASVYGDLLTFVKTVAVSGLLAEIWVIEDPTAAMPHASSNAEQMLQMEAEDVQSAVTEISQALPGTSTLFEIDLGDTQAQ
ncbi:MAG: HDOD domain-containing protein [Acidobacteriota bacterium]|nr:HDOD domain-containing protein [Acidobacteriota bacterium]